MKRLRNSRTYSWLLVAGVVAVAAWAFGPRPVMRPFQALASADDPCTATGTVSLSGRADASGVEILADGELAATTESDGSFYLEDLAPGHLSLAATNPGYLRAEAEATCPAGGQVTLAPLALPAGDANDDGAVNMYDLVLVATNYNRCADDAAFDARADFNASQCVEMQDLVLLATSFHSEGPVDWPASSSGGAGVSYATDVDPIFQSKCRLCHGDNGGLTLATYETLMKGGRDGPAILPGDSENSPLVQRLEARAEPAMPPGGIRLPDEDIETIRAWIDEGALNN